jgi:formate dehydrogenase major subunit
VERLEDGTLINQTTDIFALGGATLDNEWNHMQQKLMRGLGVVGIENQARI